MSRSSAVRAYPFFVAQSIVLMLIGCGGMCDLATTGAVAVNVQRRSIGHLDGTTAWLICGGLFAAGGVILILLSRWYVKQHHEKFDK